VTKTFRDLGVDPALCEALEAQGITHPFPIQELTLPLALRGNDLIGQARTGTGKTLAFGLPLLQRIDETRAVTQALVVVPTRELCLQVHDDLRIGTALGITSISVYGGVGYDEQIEALTSGAHVVVGTPGRLIDHLNRGNLDLSNVTELVLDEADEMLDMGFLPDVERLVEASQGEDRHTMLFSATMPTAIVKLARRYMDHPTFTRADTEAHETAPNVTQHFLQVHRMDKPRVLARILQSPGRGGVYVFVRTKHMADRLVNELEELAVPAIAIHGDLRQQTRERNLDRFRSGKANVLVATEVAARGLDVMGVTHVVNYDCPDDEKMYLHRIGRTARAGEAGAAVTFAEFNEVDRLNVIRKAVGSDTPIEQVFSTSDRLTELFDLPEERPWDHLGAKSGGRDARRAGGERSEGGRSGRERSSGGRSSGGRTGGGRTDDAARTDDAGRTDDAARTDDAGRRDGRGRTAATSDRSRTQRSRKGTTDGRPKSRRASEGRGGDHDATRPPPEPVAEERADDGPQRASRTRVRTRTRASGGDTGTRQHSDAERTGRGEPAAASDDGSDATSASSSGRGAADRDQAASGERSASGNRTSGGGRRDRGPRDGEREQRDERRRRRARSERQTDRPAEGRDRAAKDEPEPETRRTSSRGRSERRSRPRDEGAWSVKLEQRGPEARGEGQPQLARRVKVEHLP
jgi:superfamily II DNA/RNA helicase